MTENGKVTAWTVTRLNTEVKNRIESSTSLQGLWIEGEILNLTKHASGHIYLSLKDDTSTIRCTFSKVPISIIRTYRLKQDQSFWHSDLSPFICKEATISLI
jgi:exodeoxyribonuclease VII large subunit